MQSTSILAYASIVDTLGNRQIEVLRNLEALGGGTNNELAVFSGLPINQITPRMNELVKKGLVKEVEKRPCRISGRTAIEWGINRYE